MIEKVLLKKVIAKLTPERVKQLLKSGAKGAKELDKELKKVFGGYSGNTRFR